MAQQSGIIRTILMILLVCQTLRGHNPLTESYLKTLVQILVCLLGTDLKLSDPLNLHHSSGWGVVASGCGGEHLDLDSLYHVLYSAFLPEIAHPAFLSTIEPLSQAPWQNIFMFLRISVMSYFENYFLLYSLIISFFGMPSTLACFMKEIYFKK